MYNKYRMYNTLLVYIPFHEYFKSRKKGRNTEINHSLPYQKSELQRLFFSSFFLFFFLVVRNENETINDFACPCISQKPVNHQVGSFVPSVIKSFRFAVAVHIDGLNASKKRKKEGAKKKEERRKKKRRKTPEKKTNAMSHTPKRDQRKSNDKRCRPRAV